MSEGTWLDMTAYPAGDPDQAATSELLDHLHELFQTSVHEASERVDPQRWQAMLFLAVAPDQPADDPDAATVGIAPADTGLDAGYEADTIHGGDPHSGAPEQDTGVAHHGDPGAAQHGDPFDPAQDHDPYDHEGHGYDAYGPDGHGYGYGYDDHTFDDSGHAGDDVHDTGD